jgi:hypothetical protein
MNDTAARPISPMPALGRVKRAGVRVAAAAAAARAIPPPAGPIAAKQSVAQHDAMGLPHVCRTEPPRLAVNARLVADTLSGTHKALEEISPDVRILLCKVVHASG